MTFLYGLIVFAAYSVVCLITHVILGEGWTGWGDFFGIPMLLAVLAAPFVIILFFLGTLFERTFIL